MIHTRYSKYANQTLDWLDTDSFYAWTHNLKHNQYKLQQAGWLDQDPIVYRINDQGFRGDNFDPDIKFIAAGCSHTFGVGLHEHQCWVGQLEKLLQTRIQNLGIGGASMDTVYRLVDGLAGSLRPDVIFLFAPNSYRVEFCVENNSVWEVFNIHTNNNEHLKNYFINDINSAYNFQKNLKAIQYLCLEKNIQLHVLSVDHEFTADYNARDLLHSGPAVHRQIAKSFQQMYTR